MKNLRLSLLAAVLVVLTTSCSEFALLASGSSMALSQNTYAKAYGGMDFLTIMHTEKDIKRHLYDQIKYAKELRK